MRVISLARATSVPDQETGTTHWAGEDGVFDLPEPFAVHLTTKHASLWRSESEHEAAAREAQLDQLRNPRLVPAAIAALQDRVAALEGKVAEHDAALAPVERLALEDGDGDAGPSETGESDAPEGDVPPESDEGEQGQEAAPAKSAKPSITRGRTSSTKSRAKASPAE